MTAANEKPAERRKEAEAAAAVVVGKGFAAYSCPWMGAGPGGTGCQARW